MRIQAKRCRSHCLYRMTFMIYKHCIRLFETVQCIWTYIPNKPSVSIPPTQQHLKTHCNRRWSWLKVEGYLFHLLTIISVLLIYVAFLYQLNSSPSLQKTTRQLLFCEGLQVFWCRKSIKIKHKAYNLLIDVCKAKHI